MRYFLPLSFLFRAENCLDIGIFGGLTQLTAGFSYCWYSAADSSTEKLLFTKLQFLNWRMCISRTLLTVARTLQSPVSMSEPKFSLVPLVSVIHFINPI